MQEWTKIPEKYVNTNHHSLDSIVLTLTEMIALPVADGVADGVPGALDGLAVPDPVADGAPVATEAATTVENP